MNVDLVNMDYPEYSSYKNSVRIKFDGTKPIILSHIQSVELEILLKMNNKKLNNAQTKKAEVKNE